MSRAKTIIMLKVKLSMMFTDKRLESAQEGKHIGTVHNSCYILTRDQDPPETM